MGERGQLAFGPEPHGLYEDRITMLVDDGSVQGFANQGGWLTCHEGLREPFMFASAPNEDVVAHPVLGALYGQADQRKYIPQSCDTGPERWRFEAWDAVSVGNLERYAERLANGVFLGLWHWRANRAVPIGYSDNQYIFETRRSSPGTGPYATDWNAGEALPSSCSILRSPGTARSPGRSCRRRPTGSTTGSTWRKA